MRRLRHWPRRILHRLRPHKRFENSLRGVVYAHEHGYDGVDIDTRTTKDGVVVGAHDRDPWRWDKFYDPSGRIPHGTPIEALTWRQVRRLRTKDGFRIRRIETFLRVCGRLDVVAVIEPKTRAAGTLAVWQHIVAVATRRRCRVAAYGLRSHHGEETMRNARAAGVEQTRVIER